MEDKLQVWRKFIYPYAVYGVSDTLLELARQFVNITDDPRMHILYTAMLLESGQKEETTKQLDLYIRRFHDSLFDKKINLAHFAAHHGYSAYKNISNASAIYLSFERTTKSDFLKYLFYGKSIAVVGNGPSHLGKKCGSEIDAHDIVIRMNNYSVSPEYHEDYGSKTDIWLVGCGGDDVSLRKENYKSVIYGQDTRYFWGYHSDFYNYFIMERKTPCVYISRDVIHQFQNNAKLAFTSTGANFIYLLSRILPDFRSVHFYGFNFCSDSPDNYASHYFRENQTLSERLGRSHGHDFLREASILSQLIGSKG